MSALAIYLERQGLATAVVGLIREHLEKIRPPRSLWVPFELGRPLGGWVDHGEFQMGVLREAIGLLEQTVPKTIKDYPTDDPGQQPDISWSAPLSKAVDSATEEVAQLASVWQKRVEKVGGTATGLSNLTMPECIGVLDKIGSTGTDYSPFSQRDGGFFRVKLIADDIKAYYIEAALTTGRPTSNQIGDWFWNETQAGALLRRIRENNLESNDKIRQFVSARVLVPGKWL